MSEVVDWVDETEDEVGARQTYDEVVARLSQLCVLHHRPTHTHTHTHTHTALLPRIGVTESTSIQRRRGSVEKLVKYNQLECVAKPNV